MIGGIFCDVVIRRLGPYTVDKTIPSMLIGGRDSPISRCKRILLIIQRTS